MHNDKGVKEEMEKYFIVTEQSTLHKEWFAYKENKKVIRGLVEGFLKDNEIESDAYYVDDRAIYIVPTVKDAETFKSVLCSPVDDELCKFRTSSKVGKSWVKALKDAELKVKHKPLLILYFHGIGGRYKSRIFDQDGILYCSIDPVQDEVPEGFVEMKVSDFFKIVEDSGKVTK